MIAGDFLPTPTTRDVRLPRRCVVCRKPPPVWTPEMPLDCSSFPSYSMSISPPPSDILCLCEIQNQLNNSFSPSTSIIGLSSIFNTSSVSDFSFSTSATPSSQDSHVPYNYVNVNNTFSTYFSGVTSRKKASLRLVYVYSTLPPSISSHITPMQVASLWMSEYFTNQVLISDSSNWSTLLAFLYKKVANKTRPVATTLPENFHIIRLEHPDPPAGMTPLPPHPPEFFPTGHFTREH